MSRQEILSPAQRTQLLMLPTDVRQVAECYTFSPADLDLIAKRRGEPNRLGFAVQLAFLRYPGRSWASNESVPAPMLRFIAGQVGVGPEWLAGYAARDETRKEHLAELLTSGDALVQAFEPSVRDGERSLIFLGGRYSHAVRKVPAAGDFRVQTRYGASNLPHLATAADPDGSRPPRTGR